jgi:dolichol-phosphate mannosyltransferase
MTKKLISLIIPAYNEEACINELVKQLTAVFTLNDAYNFEALIIENGSEDKTWELLQEIHKHDSRFKVIRLARNFRMDGGITAGLHYANGDAVVFMTADLQDPPELITQFIKKWEEGYENVYMQVSKRRGTGPVRSFNSRAFYWLAGKLTDNRIPKNVSDYRLLDRKVYQAVRTMNERNRFVRGLVAWVGFKSIGVEAERAERFGGVSNAHSLKVIDLAFKGIFSHSYIPLKLITVTGVTLSITSFVSLVVFMLFWVFVGVPFAGFGTIVSLAVLAFGTLTFMLGIIAEYLGLIYEEVKGRPNFVVSDVLGINTENLKQ